MKIQIAVIILLLVFSVGCQPSESAIQTAIAQTQAAQRTPLAEINLDPILIQLGDLPSPYETGQITYQWPDQLPQVNTPDNLILQRIGVDASKVSLGPYAEIAGVDMTPAEIDSSIKSLYEDNYLMIALYESMDDLEQSYQDIVESLHGRGEVADVGDNSTIWVNVSLGYGFVTFTRCNALVAIEIEPYMNEDILLPFAQRIDERLESFVCNE